MIYYDIIKSLHLVMEAGCQPEAFVNVKRVICWFSCDVPVLLANLLDVFRVNKSRES